MSVDGELLTDLQRLIEVNNKRALFFLVVGSPGNGKRAALRSICRGAPSYGIAVLKSPAECFSTAQAPDASGADGQCLFVATFADIQLMCTRMYECKDAQGKDDVALRERLILVIHDIRMMWQLVGCHGFGRRFLHLLEVVRSTPLSAVLTSAVSEQSVPDPIRALASFVVYPLLPVTRPSCRLQLKTCEADTVARDENAQRVLKNLIVESVSSTTTRRSIDWAYMMAKTWWNTQRGREEPVGDRQTDAADIKDFLHFAGGEEEDQHRTVRRHAALRPLFGLQSVFDRLSMLVNVFYERHKNCISKSLGASRSLLSSINSTTGILLHGPSGCGKSALIRQLAQANDKIPFLFVRCSSLFSKYLGESEQRLRDVYRQARASSPAVVVLEDIDCISVSRGAMGEEASQSAGGVNVTKRMLAVLLCEMDGLSSSSGVLTIATSNAPDVIDAAVTRQGRLETLLYVPPLSYAGAKAMCEHFFRGFGGDGEEREAIEEMCNMIASAADGTTASSLEYLLRKILERCVIPVTCDHEPVNVTLPCIPVQEIMQSCIASGFFKPVRYTSQLLNLDCPS